MNLDKERTDIWFTMGPESIDPEVVNAILNAGGTGVRLTFSYGTPSLQEQYASIAKEASRRTDQDCTIVADLAGEKVRLGELGGREEISIDDGDTVKLVSLPAEFDPNENRIPVDSKEFLQTLRQDDSLIVGDGSVMMDVTDVSSEEVVCEVTKGGTLSRKRGIVVQEGEFEPSALTETDREHLDFIAQSDAFDAVALSFVSSAEEVRQAKEVLESHGNDLPVVAKIETQDGVRNATEIATESEAVMVARGDLALFLPWHELEKHVDSVVRAAREANTPWIMATQVAEGLERFAFPTRAEICDLARWRNRGINGVLLSYETAFGSDPPEAVSSVNRLVN